MTRSLAAIAASLLIAACTNQPDPGDGNDPPVLVRNAVRATEAHQALIHGVLVLDDAGCIRVGNPRGDAGPFVIWHHDSRIERTSDGRIRITDGFTGNTIHIGEPIALGGSGGPDAPANVIPDIPAACARDGHGFWMAGDLASQAQRRQMLERERGRIPAPPPPNASP